MLDILVANMPVAYNMILGRLGLNALQSIPNTYHMMVKFPTGNGLGEVWGYLRLARECYLASISMAQGIETPWRKIEKNPAQGETYGRKEGREGEKPRRPLLAVSFLFEGSRDPKMEESVDKLDEVPLREDHLGQCIKISAELKDPLRG